AAARCADPMAEAPGARGAGTAYRPLRRRARPAGAARRALACAHAVGCVHRRRRDPPLVAPGARRAAPCRLRGGARSRAPRRDEPLAPLLEPARAALSGLARSARAPRARRRHASRPERHPMRILHTMLRVGNMDRSVKFYTEVLGMKLLRTTDRPEQKYSLAFVGYDDEKRSAVL